MAYLKHKSMRRIVATVASVLILFGAPICALASTLGSNTGNPAYTQQGWKLWCTGGPDCLIKLQTFEAPPAGITNLGSTNSGYLVGITMQIYASSSNSVFAPQAIVTYTNDGCTAGAVTYNNGFSTTFSATQIPGVGPLGFRQYTLTATSSIPIPLSGVECITFVPTTANPITDDWYTVTDSTGVPSFVMISSNSTSSWELNTQELTSLESNYTGGPNDYTVDCAVRFDIFASSTFSLPACVGDLFGWPTDAIEQSGASTINLFLQSFPLGYATRFVQIVSGSATGTVPVIQIALPPQFADINSADVGLDGTTTLDFQSAMDQSSHWLTDPDQYGNSFWGIVMPIWQVFVYAMLVIAIIMHALAITALHRVENFIDKRKKS